MVEGGGMMVPEKKWALSELRGVARAVRISEGEASSMARQRGLVEATPSTVGDGR
jgi:hypothetical protein